MHRRERHRSSHRSHLVTLAKSAGLLLYLGILKLTRLYHSPEETFLKLVAIVLDLFNLFPQPI